MVNSKSHTRPFSPTPASHRMKCKGVGSQPVFRRPRNENDRFLKQETCNRAGTKAWKLSSLQYPSQSRSRKVISEGEKREQVLVGPESQFTVNASFLPSSTRLLIILVLGRLNCTTMKPSYCGDVVKNLEGRESDLCPSSSPLTLT